VPDWEEDSLRLGENLVAALKLAAHAAERRAIPSLTAARNWHKRINRGLVVPRAGFVGVFRGEPGLERIHARVGSRYGAKPGDVAKALNEFETKLQAIVAELDASVPSPVRRNQDHLSAVIEVCAWAHSEWVRIHPFVNGNGRTARLWANSIAMRYGLPPFLSLRPRPGARYASASARAMHGDWTFAAVVFRELLGDFLDNA
jgi:fido (protein-threonine AMPylation protein)